MRRATSFIVAALIILVIIAASLYYAYSHRAGPQSQLPVIRIGTLRGGVSSLDVILEKHLDTANGFQAKVTYFTTTLDLANAIAHGDIDVAIIPAEFVAKLREHGSNVVILAVDFYQNQAVVVRKDSDITSIEGLKGKKVAVFKPTGTYAMFKAYMDAIYDIDVEDEFDLVNAPPPQLVQAFARGDVDAVVIWEPFVSRLVADYNGRILVSYQQLWLKWDDHVGDNGVMIVYAARGSWAVAHKRLVDKLLTARSKAAELWNTDEGLAEKILVENYGLSREAAKLCWERLKMETLRALSEDLVKNILAVWELAKEGGYISSSPESLEKGAFWQAGQ